MFSSRQTASLCTLVLAALVGCERGDSPLTTSDAARRAHQLNQDDPSVRWIGSATPGLTGRSVKNGLLAPETPLEMRIGLNLENPRALDKFLEELYDPQNPNYQKYLDLNEFTARFHPNAAVVDIVRAALEASGFKVSQEAHGTLLHAQANVLNAEAFFHTTIASFTDPNGNSFFAPETEIAVDEDLPISGVFGLHTAFPHRTVHPGREVDMTKATASYMNAAAIRSVYNVPSNLTGAGQTIALYELDGYTAGDIALYAKNNNIKQIPIQNVLVNGYNGSAGSGAGEVTIDIELINALMPDAAQLRVFEAGQGAGALDEWNELANPTLGDKKLMPVISTSWGLAEDETSASYMQLEYNIYKQMAAQGQTVIAASGDSGADDDGSTLGVDDPASQPYVLSAGGTTMSQSNGVYQSESAWNDGGGGISSIWPIPSWQKGHISVAAGASSTMRNVPDVSLDANPSTGYLFYYQGQLGLVGGTSCAAPLWAAMLSLGNQARANAGLASIGFASPTLYSIATSGAYGTAFHDITSGNNGHYSAAAGFDNATGWGSFNGAGLVNALVGSSGSSSGTGSGSGSGSGTTSPVTTGPVVLASNTSYCMDLNGANTANGTQIQTWGCNGSAAQNVTYSGGQLQIAGKCVQTSGSTAGSQLSINDCSSAATQQWVVEGSYVVLANTNLCINVPNAAPANGTRLQVWTCNGSGAQTWSVKGVSTSTQRPSGNTGYCLDVRSGGTADGTAVQIWPCNNTSSQVWAAGGGRLSSLWRCAGVTALTAGTPIKMFSCTETNGLQWVQSGSAWKLNGTNMCVAVPNNNLMPGQIVALETCDGSASQNWVAQ